MGAQQVQGRGGGTRASQTDPCTCTDADSALAACAVQNRGARRTGRRWEVHCLAVHCTAARPNTGGEGRGAPPPPTPQPPPSSIETPVQIPLTAAALSTDLLPPTPDTINTLQEWRDKLTDTSCELLGGGLNLHENPPAHVRAARIQVGLPGRTGGFRINQAADSAVLS